MYGLAKKYLFSLDPETAHEQIIKLLRTADQTGVGKWLFRMMFQVKDPRLTVKRWGLTFPNPVGLAAGFDKNAEVYHMLAALGFGFVEVGTVTPIGQPGNEKPRLFRSVEDLAVVNRMGFNNRGAYAMSQQLINYRAADIPIGVNIGKNKTTPNELAAADYEKCLEMLYAYGHYFVVNISSPNTPNLRDLQETENLRQLLRTIRNKAAELERIGLDRKPILLKVAPDMSDEQMRDVVQTAVEEGVQGIIATNTTLNRDGLVNGQLCVESGGLSGRPLTERSTAWVREIYQEVGDKVPIIGVGGIFTGQDAYDKIRAGASLVQVYTGMIFEGPAIARNINRELLKLLERDGFEHIEQAIGTEAR